MGDWGLIIFHVRIVEGPTSIFFQTPDYFGNFSATPNHYTRKHISKDFTSGLKCAEDRIYNEQ